MLDLATILHTELRGRVCLMGLGNESAGDDGFGMKLARTLAEVGQADVVLTGAAPERSLTSDWLARYDHVVFLDALDFGGAPGSVVFLDGAEIQSRFPQISTHKLSLGLLAQLVESRQSTKAWLLGVQAATLKPGAKLSPALQMTLSILRELLIQLLPHRGESALSAEEFEPGYAGCGETTRISEPTLSP